MATFHDHFVEIYLNGGSLAPYSRMLFLYAQSMVRKASIVDRIDDAIALRSLFDKLFRLRVLEPEETFALMRALTNRYEFITDDVVLISAFELYSKAVLLTKGYIPHVLEAPCRLRNHQRKRPLHVRTVRAACRGGEAVQFSVKTIGCASLLNSKYGNTLHIPKTHLKQFSVMNSRRNQIHWQAPTVFDVDSHYLKAVKYLESEINERLA